MRWTLRPRLSPFFALICLVLRTYPPRGEIEISVRWTQRLFEDDLYMIELKRLMAIRLQVCVNAVGVSTGT